ncbi:MAG: hypothetical protein ACKVOG_00555 [Rhodoglobus sp.]
MATVRGAYESTVQRHYTIAAVLIAATIALIAGIVVGMLIGGTGLGLPGASAFSSITGGSAGADEPRQGGR